MSTRRDVTIASVQMDIVIGDPAVTLAKMADWIDRAAEKRADVVIFPELVMSAGYSLGDKFYEVAETIPGRSTEALGKTAVEVLTNSVIASPMVQYRGPMVLNMPDEAWFDMKMMQKDTSLALEMGRRLAVPLPTTAIANEYLTAARGMGLTEKDFAAIFQVLAKMSGVPA